MNRKIIVTTIISILLVLSSCANKGDEQKSNADQLIIHTTLYPLQYIIEQIGQEFVVVDTIYPPGVDAHTYEPASKEITNIAVADAFVYLGANMEGFAETAASALSSQDLLLIEIGKNKDLFAQSNQADMDPHVWLDPLRMIEIGTMLTKELTHLNPELEATFNDNFLAFKNDMEELDETFKAVLSPKDNKTILVTHAAYGYWERSYGIEQLSISGVSTSDEPSQKQLADIARKAEEFQIKYVLFEQSNTNRTAEIIQEHIGAEKLRIHNLEVLTEDDIKNDADYISLMKDNLHVLDKATN